MAVVLAIALAALPFLLINSGESIDRDRFPIEAAKHLESERVFHDDASGAWLVYTQWPARRIYIDDRAELFGPQMERFSEVRRGQSVWREEFQKWGIDEALLPVDEPLAEMLRSNGWEPVFEDESFVVLERPG